VYRSVVDFLEKLNRPRALIIVLALFLSVKGFLFYRYQQLMQSAAADLPQATAERHGRTSRPNAAPRRFLKKTPARPQMIVMRKMTPTTSKRKRVRRSVPTTKRIAPPAKKGLPLRRKRPN